MTATAAQEILPNSYDISFQYGRNTTHMRLIDIIAKHLSM